MQLSGAVRMKRAGDVRDVREKENKVTLNVQRRSSSGRGTNKDEVKTSYVEEFNPNQLPSPMIVRKMISRGENEDILLIPLQLLFHLATRLRMGISTRNRSNMKGRDCIPPANLTKYICFLLDGTQRAENRAADDRKKENKVTLHAEWHRLLKEMDKEDEIKTSCVGEFNSNQ